MPAADASSMGIVSVRSGDLVAGGVRVELQLAAISDCTLRVSLLSIAADGSVQPAPASPELTIAPAGSPLAKIRSLLAPETVDWNGCTIRLSQNPLAIELTDAAGHLCQRLRIDPDGAIHFARGNGPIFGLGQGGHQFDRRGGSFPLVNGQGEGVVRGSRSRGSSVRMVGRLDGRLCDEPYALATGGCGARQRIQQTHRLEDDEHRGRDQRLGDASSCR